MRVQEGSISRIVVASDCWKALLESAVTAVVGSLFHIRMALGNRLYRLWYRAACCWFVWW